MSALQSIASLPINDHYDTTTLAREHLEHAESLFRAIFKLLESEEGIDDARQLARLGHVTIGTAAADFDTQQQVMDAQEAQQ